MLNRRLAWVAAVAGCCAWGQESRAGLWITGYYPEYEDGNMAISQVDFTTVTHAVHFSVLPNTDGSIDNATFNLSPAVCANFTHTVHKAGRKALLCVGGASTEPGFQGATTSGALTKFASNLVSFVSTNGYDGLDIDWEPLASSDVPAYTNFVKAVRAGLNGLSGIKLLTVAAPAYAEYGDSPTAEFAMFASVQNDFDQINDMTYDLSGPYDGWVTWFDSPIFDGGYTFPSSPGELVPSVNASIANFTKAGVAPGKLGIGMPFYGYIWTGGPGVTAPRQGWSAVAPTVSTPSYTEIISDYYKANEYHWDAVAQAPYLSITNTPAANDMFISYDDPKECQVKVSDARNLGLGGIMMWELTLDFSGAGQPLLTALHQAEATPQIVSAGVQNGKLTFSFSTLPLASYRILWTSNLMSGSWNTLTNNIAGTGTNAQVTDPGGIGSEARFYRVQTPP
jgi:chitinase